MNRYTVCYQDMNGSRPDMNTLLKAHDVYTETSAECFPQVWASTAGGFEEPGMLAGCAMTIE